MRVWTTAAAISVLSAAAAYADTLPEALDAAYRNNPTLAAARLNARAASENLNQAFANYLPQIDLNASVGTSRTDVTPPGLPATRADRDPETIGLQAVQPVYTGGRLNAQSDVARALSLGAREDLRSVESQILLAVIAAYEDVRRAEAEVRINQNNVDVLARQLDAARTRFEVGEITRTDVAQSEARLAGGRAGLSAAQSDLAAARANYESLVGQAPNDLAPPPPPPPAPASLEAAIAAAIERNPDLAAARQDVRAAEGQVGVERAALLPQISIVGGLSRSYDSVGDEYESEGASISAQFSMPLFEGGFAASRTRQSRLNARAADARAEAVRRAVIANVVAAWNDVAAAQRVLESAREQARANEFALSGVEEEQRVGLRTTLEVLNAQQEYLDSQRAVARAERDSYVAAHALLASMGALDAETIAVNAPLYEPAEHETPLVRGLLPWADDSESP